MGITGPKECDVLWLGLTGGIATGKSKVSQILTCQNIPVVDADLLAREVVQTGSEVLEKIKLDFGSEMILSDGSLDRKKMGELIFLDSEARLKLESLTHPAIQSLRNRRKMALEEAGARLAFYDVPLLFEKKMQGEFNQIVLVYCPRYLQLERLMSRDNIGLDEAESRLQSQLPIDSKRSLADIVIENDSSLEILEQKVLKVLDHIRSSTS